MRSRPLLLAALLALPAAAAEPLERILADVDGHPILLSEVRLLQTLKGLDRKAALEAAIDTRLMQREAARVPQAALAQDEAEAACADLKRKAPEILDHDGLCAVARREAVILKYVGFRFRSDDLDAQIEAWLKELREAATIRYNPAP